MASFTNTTIVFEGLQQRIDDLISRARYHALTNREYSLEIITHLQDHAHQFGDTALFDVCRELMASVKSPSPYLVRRDYQHAGDENNRPKIVKSEQAEAPYDDSMDRVFDTRVNPRAVKKALDCITTYAKNAHRFWFVTMKVLIHLQWIPATTKTSDFLRWVNLQYQLGWTTKRHFSFSDIGGDSKYGKAIKDTDITQWNHITEREFRDIKKYRNFALLLKTTFVYVIVDGREQTTVTDFNTGKPLDRVQFMKKANELINWGK